METKRTIEEQNEKSSTQIEKIITQNEEILTQNEKIITQNDRILDESSHRGLGETKLTERLYEPPKGFPINTVEEFKRLDETSSKERRKKLYVHLVNVGGSKLREFLNCALKMTLTDELVCKFTWKKSAETEKFGDTRVANVIYQAAKDCIYFIGPTNKAQFTSEMQEVLRATKQRFRNSLRKSTPKTPTEEEILERITELEKEIRITEDESYDVEEEEEFADDEEDA